VMRAALEEPFVESRNLPNKRRSAMNIDP
jgi:hypothetical protein